MVRSSPPPPPLPPPTPSGAEVLEAPKVPKEVFLV